MLSLSESKLLRIVLTGAGLLLLLKLYFAARLDLYSDEIFYWLASTQLALAYSDLPFMTGLLVWLGSALEPGNTLAVRALFIVMGTAMPALVYWLALPITGRQEALVSALLALCIPLGGFLGLLAVPDVPLLFFGVLAIGLFERALRTGRLGYWIGTGIVVALGLSTHYRFLLYPLAAIVFLVVFQPVRHQWRNSRFWYAVALSALGLIPIVWFNLTNQLASASFYLVERHPWTFQPAGLLHVFKQAGLVTPPLYLLLLLTLLRMLGKARRGDCSAALLASFAAVNLLFYLVLAPWTDSSSTSIHWPLSGYFPLLVYAPATLAEVYRWLDEKWRTTIARRLTIAIVAIGYCGALVALLAIGSQVFQASLQSVIGPGILSNKMAGWRQFAGYTQTLVTKHYDGASPVVVTDNYYTAAQVRFAGITDQSFTLDDDKALRDGRQLQLQLWRMDAGGLGDVSGRPLLYITEDSTLTVPDKALALESVCRHVDSLEHLDDLALFQGDKSFSYYGGGVLVPAQQGGDYRARPCPFPPWGWIDPPVAGATLQGDFHVEGWAFNEDIGVAGVYLLLDGERIARVNYGIRRPDVVEVMNVQTDPNAPFLGYDYEFDTRQFENGRYVLAIEIVDNTGVSTTYGQRPVQIRNPGQTGGQPGHR